MWQEEAFLGFCITREAESQYLTEMIMMISIHFSHLHLVYLFWCLSTLCSQWREICTLSHGSADVSNVYSNMEFLFFRTYASEVLRFSWCLSVFP